MGVRVAAIASIGLLVGIIGLSGLVALPGSVVSRGGFCPQANGPFCFTKVVTAASSSYVQESSYSPTSATLVTGWINGTYSNGNDGTVKILTAPMYANNPGVTTNFCSYLLPPSECNINDTITWSGTSFSAEWNWPVTWSGNYSFYDLADWSNGGFSAIVSPWVHLLPLIIGKNGSLPPPVNNNCGGTGCPSESISIHWTSANLVANLTAQIVAVNQAAGAATWNFGDGTFGSGNAVQHTYAHAGSYPVTLSVTNGSGTPLKTTTTVNVTASPHSNSGGINLNVTAGRGFQLSPLYLGITLSFLGLLILQATPYAIRIHALIGFVILFAAGYVVGVIF